MLALSRYSLRRGVEIKINWAGRLAVAPTMGAPFFAMVGVALAGADPALRRAGACPGRHGPLHPARHLQELRQA